MKISIMFAAMLVLIIGVSSFSQVGFSQEVENTQKELNEVEAIPSQISLYYEMIEISSLEYAEIMSGPAGNDHTALREKLIKQVRAGQAKLVANQSIVLRNAEKATVESVRQYIYASEYDPGEYLSPEAIKATTGKDILKEYPVLPPTPTAFDLKNLGLTISAEARWDEDSNQLELQLSPELVKHVGDNSMGTWKTGFSESTMTMPIFYTFRTDLNLIIRLDRFVNVCTHTPDLDGKSDHSRKVIVFVKASATELEK